MHPYGMPAPPPLERFRAMVTPAGLVIRPKSNATSWLVEAVVWVLGAAAAAAMLVLGAKGTWVPVAGAVLLVPIGLRAVVRAAGDLYFCAYDHGGRATHLVTLEPDEQKDYAALASWLRPGTGGR